MIEAGTINIGSEAAKKAVFKGTEKPAAGVSTKSQEKTAVEVTKQATSLQKFLGIAKEGLYYSVTDNDLMRGMAAAGVTTAQKTTGILKGVQTLINMFSFGSDEEAMKKKGADVALRQLERDKKLFELEGKEVPDEIKDGIRTIKESFKNAAHTFESIANEGEALARSVYERKKQIDRLSRRTDLSEEEKKTLKLQREQYKKDVEQIGSGVSTAKKQEQTFLSHPISSLASAIGTLVGSLGKGKPSFDTSTEMGRKMQATFEERMKKQKMSSQVLWKESPPKKDQDAIITKSGVLSDYYVEAGEKIIPPDSAAKAKRYSYGGLARESRAMDGKGSTMTTTTTVGDIHVHVMGEGKNVEALFKDNGPVEQAVLRVLRDKKVNI